jgi:hypothetical protein
MILIDMPIVAYKTWGISLLRKTEDGYVEDYEAEEEYERHSDLCRAYPYSLEHPHIK